MPKDRRDKRTLGLGAPAQQTKGCMYLAWLVIDFLRSGLLLSAILSLELGSEQVSLVIFRALLNTNQSYCLKQQANRSPPKPHGLWVISTQLYTVTSSLWTVVLNASQTNQPATVRSTSLSPPTPLPEKP